MGVVRRFEIKSQAFCAQLATSLTARVGVRLASMDVSNANASSSLAFSAAARSLIRKI